MIKHYCDVCGAEVDRDNGLIDSQEITIELDGKKVSVNMQVMCYHYNNPGKDEPTAVCAICLAQSMNQWADEVRAKLAPVPAASKTAKIHSPGA